MQQGEVMPGITSDSNNEMEHRNTAPVLGGKAEKKNGFKIATIVLAVVAVCGIAFGVYNLIQNLQKDRRIADLEAQIDSPQGSDSDNDDTEPVVGGDSAGSDAGVKGLYLLGDLSTKRKYYLGTSDLDAGQDSREKAMYIIDTTKLGLADGVKEYDLKPVLERALTNVVAKLPEVLAEGSVNATPKSDCQSYKVVAQEPNNLSDGLFGNWTMLADWNEALPLGVYVACMKSDGSELSVGSELYSLNPNTNELFLVNKGGLTRVE